MNIKYFIKNIIFTIADKRKKKKIMEIGKIKKILFIRNARIGDMVTLTPVFREIKKKYSDIAIDVLSGIHNSTVVNNNPWIESNYIYKKEILSIIKLFIKLRKEKYDIVVEFNELNSVSTIIMMRFINGAINIGFNKTGTRLYDYSIECRNKRNHVMDNNRELLKLFGITNMENRYEIYYTIEEEKCVTENIPEIYILININGSTATRTINEENTLFMIEQIKKRANVSLIAVSGERDFTYTQKIFDKAFVKTVKTNTLGELAFLIKKAVFVITPDTSIVHICGCYNKRLIALYPNNKGNYEGWKPIVDKFEVIFAKNGEDINNFDKNEFVKALENIMKD